MAFSPITSWQIYWETVTDFIFGSSKITLDGDCSQEIKRSLPLGRKAMTNLDSILKNRNITLLTKVHLLKTMVFPVLMYGCESWTIRKAVTNLDSILKSRDITSLTKIHVVKAVVFPTVMLGCGAGS